MGMLGNIFDRIFRKGDKSQDATVASAPGAQASPASAGAQGQPAGGGATAAGASAAAAQPVDIEVVMNDLAARNSEKLNWRTSIVDLLKLLDLDSSLQSRKDLADELGYTGDKSDSAAMNIWLHKQVMRKVAENGGKVPADLRD